MKWSGLFSESRGVWGDVYDTACVWLKRKDLGTLVREFRSSLESSLNAILWSSPMSIMRK